MKLLTPGVFPVTTIWVGVVATVSITAGLPVIIRTTCVCELITTDLFTSTCSVCPSAVVACCSKAPRTGAPATIRALPTRPAIRIAYRQPTVNFKTFEYSFGFPESPQSFEAPAVSVFPPPVAELSQAAAQLSHGKRA